MEGDNVLDEGYTTGDGVAVFVKQLTARLFALSAIVAASAQPPAGDEILQRLDANLAARNRTATITMTVHGRRGSRTLTARSWIQGEEKAFTEYLSPAREKGTKILKIGDQLWLYSPRSDRTIRIAGHMLRQSLMGSDLSYEDMLEDPRLSDNYSATVIAEEQVNERPCWVLDLQGRTPDLAYPSRKVWVDQQRFLILKENRYAKSGTLLKTTEVKEVFLVQDRWYPKRIAFRDMLSKNQGTEVIIENIRFNVEIPDYLFTKAALRR
jgi:outer membrane lipoprotein-sorting protein